jgi:hypothetical protein
MGCAVEYREFEQQLRSAAEVSTLPMVRQRHLEAAERWAQLAEELERFEIPEGKLFKQEYFY